MIKFIALLSSLTALGLNSIATAAGTNAPASANPNPVNISASEAKDHVGDHAVVTGKIAEVNQNDKVLRMNFEQPFPNQALTAIIFGTNTNLFKNLNLQAQAGKTVEVNGKLVDYHGHPEIILASTNQVKLLDKTPADSKKP